MDDLANTGAAAPADDLRSEIENAFKADATASEAPQGQEQVTPLTPAPVDPSLTAGEQAAADQRARDELGRFTKAEQAAKANEAVAAAQKAVQPGQQPAVVDPASVKPVGPPPGWSPTSKAAFDALPDAVKKDIAKREEEISAGFAKLTEYKGLDPYVEMARGNGTTLPESLERYVAAENLLDSNPINGILWLCERYQVHPANLLEAIGQGQGHQQPPGQDPFAPVFSHIQTLDQRLSQFEAMREQSEDQAVNSQIEAFATDAQHKYFSNVRKEMGQLIALADQQGQTLSMKDAYEKACWANPEIRELFIKDRYAADQAAANRKADEARRAAGSLSPGSPVPGGTLAAHEPASSLREEIERSFNSARV